MAGAGKINTSSKKSVLANRVLTAIVNNSGNSLENMLTNDGLTTEKLKAISSKWRSCSSADEHRISGPATMSESDTVMENVELRGASSGEGCSNTLALHILLGLFNI